MTKTKNKYYTMQELAELTGRSIRSIHDWAAKAAKGTDTVSLTIRVKLHVDMPEYSSGEVAAILRAGQMERLAELILTK